jgi:hypothetical protein
VKSKSEQRCREHAIEIRFPVSFAFCPGDRRIEMRLLENVRMNVQKFLSYQLVALTKDRFQIERAVKVEVRAYGRVPLALSEHNSRFDR